MNASKSQNEALYQNERKNAIYINAIHVSFGCTAVSPNSSGIISWLLKLFPPLLVTCAKKTIA